MDRAYEMSVDGPDPVDGPRVYWWNNRTIYQDNYREQRQVMRELTIANVCEIEEMTGIAPYHVEQRYVPGRDFKSRYVILYFQRFDRTLVRWAQDMQAYRRNWIIIDIDQEG